MIAAGIAATIALAIASQLHRVRGTTLTAPLIWAITAAAGVAAVESLMAVRSGGSAATSTSLLRYAVACGTVCPGMAVLGAKRPQDRAWQWVVLSLWCVLLLPAGQTIASGGASLRLSGMWILFWGVLILTTGPLNYLLSRHCLASLLLACGQVCLLMPFLPALPGSATQWQAATGASSMLGCCFALAALVAALLPLIWSPSVPEDPDPSDCAALLGVENDRWRWFRNAFGSFWELRVMHRVNQTAQLANWPIRLERRGFVGTGGDQLADSATLSEDQIAKVRQTLDSLLWRFEKRRDAHRPDD